MSQALPAELDGLIFRGFCIRGDPHDEWGFLLELAEFTARGEVTATQAAAIRDILGLDADEHAAAVERASA